MQLSDSDAHAFAQLVRRGADFPIRPVDRARLQEAELQTTEAFQNWKNATDGEPWARRVNSLRTLAQERAAYASELFNALRGKAAVNLAERADASPETLAALLLLYTLGPDGQACLNAAALKGLHVWDGRGRLFDPVPACSNCGLRQDVWQARQSWEQLQSALPPVAAPQQSSPAPRPAWSTLPATALAMD